MSDFCNADESSMYSKRQCKRRKNKPNQLKLYREHLGKKNVKKGNYLYMLFIQGKLKTGKREAVMLQLILYYKIFCCFLVNGFCFAFEILNNFCPPTHTNNGKIYCLINFNIHFSLFFSAAGRISAGII